MGKHSRQQVVATECQLSVSKNVWISCVHPTTTATLNSSPLYSFPWGGWTVSMGSFALWLPVGLSQWGPWWHIRQRDKHEVKYWITQPLLSPWAACICWPVTLVSGNVLKLPMWMCHIFPCFLLGRPDWYTVGTHGKQSHEEYRKTSQKQRHLRWDFKEAQGFLKRLGRSSEWLQHRVNEWSGGRHQDKFGGRL